MAWFMLRMMLLSGDMRAIEGGRTMRCMQGLSVLLVDDDEWIRDSMGFLCDSMRASYTCCETAEEALLCLKDHRFDVIIVDFLLPGLDGLGLLRLIPSSHPDCVKILITAYGSKGLFSEAEQCGVDECIDKPLKADALESCFTRLVPRDDVLDQAKH